jgi:hypothetical protein
MPEVSQYTFQHKELLELLIKHAGLHQGRWMLAVNFGFAALNSGPSPDQFVPSAVVAVQSLSIVKAAPEMPEALVMDAGEVNALPREEASGPTPQKRSRRAHTGSKPL